MSARSVFAVVLLAFVAICADAGAATRSRVATDAIAMFEGMTARKVGGLVVVPMPGEALASWLLRYAEPFGIAPDGARFTVAGGEQLLSVMMAEGLADVAPAR